VAAHDVEAVVLSSDLRLTGTFSCSEPDLERLHENVVRSMRGNFLDVPTDCPQRDERLGWTGDIQIFAPTATFLAESAGFLTSWLADLVRAAGFRISTGFVGTPLIMDALTVAGEHDVAYRLLLERGCPSWLYPVTMGATTIW
jgi:hypothetical protein